MNNIWFLMPSVDAPTGGINNCYRICKIADELGIKARVISEYVYPFCDPEDNSKYWTPCRENWHNKYDVLQIREGDIIVQPEIYSYKMIFSVPVRRVLYIQNWSTMDEYQEWVNHIWTYNNWTHLSYCMESLHYTNYIHRDRLPAWRPVDWPDTAKMIQKKKLKWSCVTPYFDFDKFSTGINDPNKILMLPRKMGNSVELFQRVFGDKLVIVDGVTPEELRNIYREVGILVLPSAAEGLSFPMVEALLSGCCVVSWECGAPEEYLIPNETSMMADYGDIDGLISHTKFLLDNPNEQKRLSLNGRNLVTSLYSGEKTKVELYVAYHASLKIKPEL